MSCSSPRTEAQLYRAALLGTEYGAKKQGSPFGAAKKESPPREVQ